MQVESGAARTPEPPRRRVRDDVRDSIGAAAFSVGAAVAVALTLQLIVWMAG
jgi:hypothetical protein